MHPTGRPGFSSASKEDTGSHTSEESGDEQPGNDGGAFLDKQSPAEVGSGLRYVGHHASSSMFDELTLSDNFAEYNEQTRRSKTLIEEIPTAMRDHLMELFWARYNSILHVVHRQSFEEGQERAGTHSYNVFLHICMMAMGCMLSDGGSLRRYPAGLHDLEKKLQKESKAIADCGLGTRREAPNVQALLILSDMEYARGRENMGWMYGGTLGICHSRVLQLITNRRN